MLFCKIFPFCSKCFYYVKDFREDLYGGHCIDSLATSPVGSIMVVSNNVCMHTCVHVRASCTYYVVL